MHFIYGKNSVREWLESGLPVARLFIAREMRAGDSRIWLKMATHQGIAAAAVPRAALFDMLGHDRHQGILAEVRLPGYFSVPEIVEKATREKEAPFIVLLDGIQDPQNLGAILRTADAAGVHGVIIPKDKAAGLTPAVIKASAGAAVHVPVARVTNLVREIEQLKKAGLWITGTEGGSDRMFTEVNYQGGTAVVLGSEGRGMRRLVRDVCDYLVAIPMRGKVQSLNVSVAAALMMFEVHRQRHISMS